VQIGTLKKSTYCQLMNYGAFNVYMEVDAHQPTNKKEKLIEEFTKTCLPNRQFNPMV
jgi:hypothetical protein